MTELLDSIDKLAGEFAPCKASFTVNSGEKLACVIALGYGKSSGVPHKSKPMADLMKSDEPVPDWFRHGMEAAMLAPTAMNQQKFLFTRNGNQVTAKAGFGFYSQIDLGIAKYHFEIGAGESGWQWGN